MKTADGDTSGTHCGGGRDGLDGELRRADSRLDPVRKETQAATVLVVEDEAGVRRLIGHILCGHGFTVLDAASASQGLALFRHHQDRIGLVITDVVMPGMGGLDLAAELERDRPGVHILYMSGYTDSVVVESLKRQAPEVVLPKPFTAASLVDRVTNLLKAA